MKYKAVIFDLFGTLIDNFSVQQHKDVLRQTTAALPAPPADFLRLWHDTFNERCTGVFPSTEANIEYVCQKLGVPVADRQVNAATRIWLDLVARSMTPLPESVTLLSNLKNKGYKTGLISDCSAEVPAIWQDTPFSPLIDVPVFSCKVGIKKPDLRIYHLAAERLGVEPFNCLYIGDGSSQELSGAAAAGMHPVLICAPNENSPEVYRVDAETNSWDGPRISSLLEVLTLLK